MGYALRGGGDVVFDMSVSVQVHQSRAVRPSVPGLQIIDQGQENRMEHKVRLIKKPALCDLNPDMQNTYFFPILLAEDLH